MIVEVVFYRENAISPQVAPPGFTLRFPVQSRSLGKSRIVRSSLQVLLRKTGRRTYDSHPDGPQFKTQKTKKARNECVKIESL